VFIGARPDRSHVGTILSLAGDRLTPEPGLAISFGRSKLRFRFNPAVGIHSPRPISILELKKEVTELLILLPPTKGAAASPVVH
jgi:hypothetical protein